MSKLYKEIVIFMTFYNMLAAILNAVGNSAKLPRIELMRPGYVVGKNTVAAMQVGVIYGYVGQVEGIVTRMKAQSKEEPTVIATGGFADLIASETTIIDVVDNFLTLKGLHLIYKRNM